MQGGHSTHRFAFGPFVLDVRTGELWKGSVRLRVPDQSIEVLKALLERPGELVTREELRQRLWPDDTFVDFEQGLNGIVRRLRDALGDSADGPKFIETLPRRGYRFIGIVSAPDPVARAGSAIRPVDSPSREPIPRGHNTAFRGPPTARGSFSWTGWNHAAPLQRSSAGLTLVSVVS
jgi:DNA-binding winged helix-turn-helix (wHTH) protein